jgi:hypothetical protein
VRAFGRGIGKRQFDAFVNYKPSFRRHAKRLCMLVVADKDGEAARKLIQKPVER